MRTKPFILTILAVLLAGSLMAYATVQLTEPEACPDHSVKSYHAGKWFCLHSGLSRRSVLNGG